MALKIVYSFLCGISSMSLYSFCGKCKLLTDLAKICAYNSIIYKAKHCTKQPEMFASEKDYVKRRAWDRNKSSMHASLSYLFSYIMMMSMMILFPFSIWMLHSHSIKVHKNKLSITSAHSYNLLYGFVWMWVCFCIPIALSSSIYWFISRIFFSSSHYLSCIMNLFHFRWINFSCMLFR